jgi:chromosome partitioning protein
VLAQAADLTILPFMQSQTDLRVARADLDRLPDAVGLPNRWPTQRWAREVADKELAAELDGYMHRLMSPVPEINGYVSLLRDTGAAPRVNPPCRQLALRVLERMGLSLYSFKTQQHYNTSL